MNIKDHFYNFDLEYFPISDKIGLGYEFEVRGIKYITTGRYSQNNPDYRYAEFSVTSFIGAGGIHFYGNLKINTSNRSINSPDGFNHSIGGYMGGVVLPNDTRMIRIDLVRPITELDIKIDPDRYKGCDSEMLSEVLVNGFYDEKELIDTFKQLIPQLFKGKWAIEIDSFSGNYDEEILIDI